MFQVLFVSKNVCGMKLKNSLFWASLMCSWSSMSAVKSQYDSGEMVCGHTVTVGNWKILFFIPKYG